MTNIKNGKLIITTSATKCFKKDDNKEDINSFLAINFTTCIKWINSLKNTTYKNERSRKCNSLMSSNDV